MGLGCCLRKPWQHCRHLHSALPGARKVEKELQDRLTSVTELACVSQADPKALTPAWASQQSHVTGVQPHEKHLAARQPPAKSGFATPNPARTPAVQRCSGLSFAGCQMWVFLVARALLSACGFPHTMPHCTQRIQWLNAEDLGAVLLHPPKEMT